MTFQTTVGIWLRALSQRMPATRGDINKLTEIITMKITELASGLAELKVQTEKSRGEILAAVVVLNAKITALEQTVADLNGGELSPDVIASFDGLKASVQAIDDLNADATPPVDPATP